MLMREQFHTAGRIELELAGVGLPGRVVAIDRGAVGLVLAREPGRGVLGVLGAALALVLGPCKLARRGRRVVALVAEPSRVARTGG